MKTHTKITRHEHHIITDADRRCADIRLVDGAFDKCKFYGVSPTYTIDDWRFLYDVAGTIVAMQDVQEFTRKVLTPETEYPQ